MNTQALCKCEIEKEVASVMTYSNANMSFRTTSVAIQRINTCGTNNRQSKKWWKVATQEANPKLFQREKEKSDDGWKREAKSEFQAQLAQEMNPKPAHHLAQEVNPKLG